MADEFSKLQNVSLISESDLRDDVAANIEAKSSKESIADQTLVKNAWRAFQEAEQLVNNLHGQLRTAELNEANKAIGVTNNAVHTESDKDQNNTSQTVLSAAALRFKHNAALRELNKKGEKLRQVQREVEERQHRRLEEIRNRQRTEAIHEQMRAHSNDGMDTIATNTMHEESNVIVKESPSLAVVTVREERQHNYDNVNNHNKNINTKSDALERNQIKSHEHTARPQRVFGTTLTSYSGGAVLPSLNRVLVSRADIQAKHLRYEDDADIALYAARLRKRKKLEKANALLRAQRRHDQVNYNDELQSSQTSSEFTDFTDTQSIITSVSTNTNTTITANTDALNDEKNDNNDEGNNNNRNNKIVKEEKTITNVKRENESHDEHGNNNQFTNSTSAASPAVVEKEKMHKLSMNENGNSPGKVKMENLEEQELLEHQSLKEAEWEEEAKDNNPITAIDIDALMEEEEDVGDDLVQKLLAEQQQTSSFSSESRTNDKEGKGSVIKIESNTFEEEEEKELMKSAETKTRQSSKNRHPIDYSHITLKPERQVEIIPGIKISARIYRRLFPYQQDGLR